MHASQTNSSCDEAPDDDTRQPRDNHSPIRHTLPFRLTDTGCGRLLAVWLILTLLLSPAEAVRCFCDRRNCEDALVCTGLRCLVGFKSDVRLDQMCTTDDGDDDGQATLAVGECAVDWPSAGGWREVCACGEDFCNTFAFLRHQMSSQGGNIGTNVNKTIAPSQTTSRKGPHTTSTSARQMTTRPVFVNTSRPSPITPKLDQPPTSRIAQPSSHTATLGMEPTARDMQSTDDSSSLLPQMIVQMLVLCLLLSQAVEIRFDF